MKKTTQTKPNQSTNFFGNLFSNKGSFLYLFISGLIVLVILNSFYQSSKKNNLKNNVIPKVVKRLLQNENANFEISNLKDSNGLYEFQLTLKDQNNQKYTSYITRNGKLFFTSGINLEQLFNQQSTNQNQSTKKQSCNDLQKSKTPKLTAYVMANCPFGLQMQRVFKNVINTNVAAQDNLKVEYIFNQESNFETGDINSLHGQEEAKENLRQICLREEQKDLYWPYVACYMLKENNSENCLSQAGVDISSLNGCMDDKNRGLKYAKKDFENTKRLGVSGSPTLVLNDQQLVDENGFGGRTADAIKEILCCSADKKLTYCNQEFSKNAVVTSFSETDEQVAGAASSGGCN